MDIWWVINANAPYDPELDKPLDWHEKGFKCPECAQRASVELWYIVCEECNLVISYQVPLNPESVR